MKDIKIENNENLQKITNLENNAKYQIRLS